MPSIYDKLKVLVVDDNRTNLHILKVFLNKLGHEAILAENGQEAVDQFKLTRPDLVLMDIMMPIMDGFEATRQIKALSGERWVPVIFVSAMSRDENLVEGLEAGGDDYLTKPINFVVLEAKIASVRRSLEMQNQAINSLKRLQSISDAVLDVIVTVDEFGIIKNCNRAVELVYGWRPRELVGQSVTKLLHQRQEQGWLSSFLEAPQGMEVQAQRSDGTELTIEARVSDLVLDGQQLYVFVLHDVTERKASEQKLQHYYDHNEQEQALATTLFEMQLHRPALQDPNLHYWIKPNATFSGDMIAGGRAPNGMLYALLADATGHGLGAAISALPALSIFYRMSRLGSPIQDMIQEINQQLKESIPVGRFVALTLVCLNLETRQGTIWVGGTPAVSLLDQWGRLKQQFQSAHLPLGILPNSDVRVDGESFTWEPGSQLLMFSDGVLEAENEAGEPFGFDRLIQSLANTYPADRMQAVQGALAHYLGQTNAQDDISVMLVDCP